MNIHSQKLDDMTLLTHLLDDSEKELAKLKRRVREAVELLTLAQAASHSGKMHVVEDHIERAMEALSGTTN